MKILLYLFVLALAVNCTSCNTQNAGGSESVDTTFKTFEDVFLDAYWKQYPASSIFNGYGKYYEKLVLPDSSAVANNISFSRQWTDSLKKLDYQKLNDNNKISFNIIKNQLESDNWYQSVFKQYEWDASLYNLSGECYYLINQPWAALDDRLKTLSIRLEHAPAYYQAAFNILHRPTREHVELAILQNQGGISVFEGSLTDSIKASHLSNEEKNTLSQNAAKTVASINQYIASLKGMLNNKNQEFRDFAIGAALFTEKFKYDIAADISPEALYAKAKADKGEYYKKMYRLSDSLWAKYYQTQTKPTDTVTLIQAVINKIQLQHAAPKDFFDTLSSQVHQLKKFIVEKDLFDFDTTYPIIVRYMPDYARGVTLASAEFVPPYQKQGETYYNVDDLTLYSKEKAGSALQEVNNYMSQLLSIHEAMPGHCLQGIYNNKKSGDVVRSVFSNGAMIEGWAVYTEGMMLENGWGGHAPEMELLHDKMKLRELANVLIDYDMQVLKKPKAYIMHILVNECFQTQAQAEEKYHRATVSQVQLCSYYAGNSAIMALRNAYQKKMGDQYSLKSFHETFLSFGSSPVKYISERMLQ
ncbi:MAG: DUF885 domain-containing protein [Ferruginibacter sp.]